MNKVQTRSITKLIQEVNVENLFYEIHGEKNKNTITLIHGLTSAGSTWLPIIEHLSKTFKVLVYDQRGHGNSAEAGYNYSLESMADDLNRLLNFKKIQKTHLLGQFVFIIIFTKGHSFGGRTAMCFCEKYPQRVCSLIVEDMTFQKIPSEKFESVKETADKMIKVFNKDQLYKSQEDLEQKMLKFYTKLETLSLMEKKAIKLENGKVQLMFKPHVRELYNYYSRNADFMNLLKTPKIPILILRASSSTDIPKDIIAKTKQKGQQVLTKTIKNSEHNIHGSQTKAFLKELDNFMVSLV